MMETVEVLVKVFDRGQTKEVTVPVEAECFDPERLCWKSIANIKAAALLEVPFTLMERAARYGLRRVDRERLRAMYGGKDGAHCAPLQAENGGKDDGAGN